MKDLEPANNYLSLVIGFQVTTSPILPRRGAAPFLGRRGLQAGLKCPAEHRERP